MHAPARECASPDPAVDFVALEDERSSRARRGFLRRHARKCCVCRHPDREAIEQDYLRWHSPERIGREFDIHYSAVYRHAQATGLLARRQGGLRATLENFLEHADSVRVTPSSIVSAVRLCAQLNRSDNIIERTKAQALARLPNGRFAKRCVRTYGPSSSPNACATQPSSAPGPHAKNAISNRKLAFDPSHLNHSESANDPALIANFEPSPRARKRTQKGQQ